VALGSSAEQALEGVRLVMLAHGVCLRQRIAHAQDPSDDPARFQPAAAFSPVAVTLDELGPAWQEGRIRLSLHSTRNGRKQETRDAAQGMQRHFGQLIARLCSTRPVRAGSIVGGGSLVAPLDPPETAALQPGESVRTEMLGPDGKSIFGAIDQRVTVPGSASG
jgi:fumarylacetoacetate (FAA) hydrolase